jgi:hypothetical protein
VLPQRSASQIAWRIRGFIFVGLAMSTSFVNHLGVSVLLQIPGFKVRPLP